MPLASLDLTRMPLDLTSGNKTKTKHGTGRGGGRDGDGAGDIGFAPVDGGGDRGCVSWAAVLTLEAVHRVLGNPTVVLELFR